MAMKHIKEVMKDTSMTIPMTGEEMLLIKQAREKIKQATGISFGYKKLLLYLAYKELNG